MDKNNIKSSVKNESALAFQQSIYSGEDQSKSIEAANVHNKNLEIYTGTTPSPTGQTNVSDVT